MVTLWYKPGAHLRAGPDEREVGKTRNRLTGSQDSFICRETCQKNIWRFIRHADVVARPEPYRNTKTTDF